MFKRFLKPRIVFGVSFEEMVEGDSSAFMVTQLLQLYSKEKFILTLRQRDNDFEVLVAFEVGATNLSVLRSVWQAYWVHENCSGSHDVLDQLTEGLRETEKGFEDFIHQLDEAGWDMHNINLKLPSDIFIDEMDTS